MLQRLMYLWNVLYAHLFMFVTYNKAFHQFNSLFVCICYSIVVNEFSLYFSNCGSCGNCSNLNNHVFM